MAEQKTLLKSYRYLAHPEEYEKFLAEKQAKQADK